MLEYRLQILDAKAHVFAVSMTVPHPAPKQVVSLPVWIPGSYLVREFSRHLSRLQAFQKGKAVEVKQLDKCTWEIGCDPDVDVLEVSWQVYAFDTSVRAAYLDQRRGFVNGTCAFLRVHGREDEVMQLTVVTPKDKNLKGWDVACALPVAKGVFKGALAVYRARNYDELVDSPIELGQFWRGQFRSAGVVHEFVVAGSSSGFDGHRLLADAQKICEAAILLWHGKGGKPPFKRYVFMLNVVGEGYGGLEHCASTALICERSDLPQSGEQVLNAGYQKLLGLISHEYFHAWNVKRMRPQELAYYDYMQENYTELLWFFEGFTSYYEDRVLRLAGVLNDEQYAKALADNFNAMEAMPGRFVQTVAQASFDAWVKYYRVDENTGNATISYYTKGAMVALCLDLTLRHEGKGTLDDVMRLLWQRHDGGPISQSDIAQALKEVGGRSYAKELRMWVHGTVELPVEKLLQRAGVSVRREPATVEQKLGLKLAQTSAGVMVKSVKDGYAAQRAGISAGDELLGVNGWRMRSVKDWAIYASKGEAATVLVARDGLLMTMEMKMPSDKEVQGTARFEVMGVSGRKKLSKMLHGWV